MAIKTGIVLLNWNNWQDTCSCLESFRSLPHSESELSYYVVDNGSQDESPLRLEAIEDIHLTLLEENLGFAGGSNYGIQAALRDGCDYVLLFNNDAYPQGDFLEHLLEVFKQDARAGISSPKIYYANPSGKIWYAGGKFHPPRLIGEMVGMGEMDKGQHDLARKVDFAVGCCMLIRREVFEAIGLLDPAYFFYLEDVDFSYRATQAGFSIWYQPAASIVHDVSLSTRDNLQQRMYLYSQSRVVFLVKHIRGYKIALVVGMEAVRMLRTVIGHVWRGETSLASSYIKGSISGIQKGRQRSTEAG
jgi:GT2 family glycosyltransferase